MNLNFKKFGESGPSVIILHGVFGFLDNWLTIGKHISEQGFQVYLIDQRNHGRSPHEGGLNYPTFAEDLHEFVVQQDLSNIILVGHSMGGKTVMEYATQYEDTLDKLVVIDIGPKAYPVHHRKIIEGLNAIPVEKIENRQQADEILAEYEPIVSVRQFLLKNLYRADEGGFAWRFNLPVITKEMPNVGAEITSSHPIKVSTLFMRGAKSNYIEDIDWADIEKLFPNSQLVTIADAGHWIHAEQPKDFLNSLMKFIKS